MHELARVSLFERLGAEELSRLSTIVKRRVFPADTVVFFEGDPSDSLYAIVSGSTKIYTTDHDGQEKVLSTMGPGEVFGEYSLIDGHPRSATVATLETSEILHISHIDFRQFVAGAPDILWKILESLTSRMRNQIAEVRELSFRDVPYRLLRVLVRLAEKHGKPAADELVIGLSMTPATLSGMVGTSPERVSRLLHRFQADGLVRHADADHLLIPDMKALRRALEYSADWS
jgi:CRP/FNR family cyclic AMP-dependent transcriptional regulator